MGRCRISDQGASDVNIERHERTISYRSDYRQPLRRGIANGSLDPKDAADTPPPAPVLGEFGNLSSPEISAGRHAPLMGGFAVERFSPGHPAAIVTMNRNIAELEPKIREFQGAVDSIEKEFREKLDKLLTPEQRKKLASIEAAEAPQTAEADAAPPPPFAFEGRGAPLLCPFRQEMGARDSWPAFPPHFRSAAG